MTSHDGLGIDFNLSSVHIQHYDDKVDIWSIGALLYKVIVGQCGFYAVS